MKIKTLINFENDSILEFCDEQVTSPSFDALFVDRSSPNTLIAFAGRNEHFGIFNKVKYVDSNILIIRDLSYHWYLGVYDSADALDQFVEECKKNIADLINKGTNVFIGQSSGGFGALLYGTYFKNSTIFAFSPQTFARNLTGNYNLYFDEDIKLPLLHNIYDLKNHLLNYSNLNKIKAHVIVPYSELLNCNEFYWADMVSAGYLIGVPGVSVHVKKYNHHSLLQSVSPNLLTEMINSCMHSRDFNANNFLHSSDFLIDNDS